MFRSSTLALVFVCLSEYFKYSVPLISLRSWTSPHFIWRCSSQPRNPRWMEFITQSVFSKLSGIEIPSKFFSYNMFTSSSITAYAAFGLFPLPCFLSSLLRASKACRTCSNSLSLIILQRYSQAFKCRLKLLEGSKSSPYFLLTATIN